MNCAKNIKLAEQLVDPSFLRVAQVSLSARQKIVTQLLSNLKLPPQGISTFDLEYLFSQFALLDTNNFPDKVGVGQREGRVFSSFVKQKNCFLSHGIGRSGDVSATQPKAAGSSLILKLTQKLAKDAINLAGYSRVDKVLFLPLATGMSILLSLLAMAKEKPEAKFVLWSRIDQKTCLKSILAAGLTPVVIQCIAEGDQLITNLEAFVKELNKLGPDNILAIVSTTSCFAPRCPDYVVELAKLAKQHKIFHLINNAYGIQSLKIANGITEAMAAGQVTAVIQSTDKNFMVPVGNSILFCNQRSWLKRIAETYPGRASSSGAVDLLATLLQMGKIGWLRLLDDRKHNFQLLKASLKEFADSVGQRVLFTEANQISIGLTVKTLGEADKEVTRLGSLLYSRQVMGHRVVGTKPRGLTFGLQFTNYGSHVEHYSQLPYMTVACSLGMEKSEVSGLIYKLKKAWSEYTGK